VISGSADTGPPTKILSSHSRPTTNNIHVACSCSPYILPWVCVLNGSRGSSADVPKGQGICEGSPQLPILTLIVPDELLLEILDAYRQHFRERHYWTEVLRGSRSPTCVEGGAVSCSRRSAVWIYALS
jgi:hypothetical protein